MSNVINIKDRQPPAASSSGRTPDFGPGNAGSNPAAASKPKTSTVAYRDRQLTIAAKPKASPVSAEVVALLKEIVRQPCHKCGKTPSVGFKKEDLPNGKVRFTDFICRPCFADPDPRAA